MTIYWASGRNSLMPFFDIDAIKHEFLMICSNLIQCEHIITINVSKNERDRS